jgi:hypothetical protein
MTLRISVVAAIALAAIVAVPGASYAASKHKGAASTETGLTNPPIAPAVRAPAKIRTA